MSEDGDAESRGKFTWGLAAKKACPTEDCGTG